MICTSQIKIENTSFGSITYMYLHVGRSGINFSHTYVHVYSVCTSTWISAKHNKYFTLTCANVIADKGKNVMTYYTCTSTIH